MENQIKPKSLDNLANEQVDGKNVKGGNVPTVVNPVVLTSVPDPGLPGVGPISQNQPHIPNEPDHPDNHGDGTDAGGGGWDGVGPDPMNPGNAPHTLDPL